MLEVAKELGIDVKKVVLGKEIHRQFCLSLGMEQSPNCTWYVDGILLERNDNEDYSVEILS
jgi:hypothetical protein